MPLQTAYKIVSHFKFEIGSAVASTQQLEGHLGRLSNRVKGINDQFKYMFTSSALSLTGGQAGIVGVLKNAVTATNDFYEAQRKLATVMTGNAKFFQNPIKDFNRNMEISKHLLSDMIKEARRFGIGVGDFIGTFNTLNPFLIPQGAAGKNFEQSRKLSRNLLMGSDIMGLSPGEAQWQLQTLVQGNLVNPNQSLFQALKQEAPEVFGNISPRGFNQLKMAQRVDKINKAFDKFLSNSDVLEARMNDVNTQVRILRDNFSSMGSVLKPLGDVLRTPVLEILQRLNRFLATEFTKTMEMVSRHLKPFISDLDKLQITLNKLMSLGATTGLAKSLAGLLFVIMELRKYIPFVAKLMARLGFVAGVGLVGGFGNLLKIIFRTKTALGGFAKLLSFIGTALASYLKFFIPLMALFRVIDSAKAHAKVEDRKKFEMYASVLAEKLMTLKDTILTIISPFTYLIDMFGKSISFLFQQSYWIEKFYSVIKGLNIEGFFRQFSDGIIKTFAVLETSLKIIKNIAIEFLKTLNPFGGQFMNFNKLNNTIQGYSQSGGGMIKANVQQHLQDYRSWAAAELEKSRTPENVINIGKVEIRNQFRENLEPDRVAVSIKETLMKAANAPISTIRRQQVFSPGVGG